MYVYKVTASALYTYMCFFFLPPLSTHPDRSRQVADVPELCSSVTGSFSSSLSLSAAQVGFNINVCSMHIFSKSLTLQPYNLK